MMNKDEKTQTYCVICSFDSIIVKLSSINTIHVKQQLSIGFSIFKLTLNYMLGNVYINKIRARQC